MAKRKSVSFLLEEDTYDAIIKLSAKTKKSPSEHIRKFIKKGLAVQSYDENNQMLYDTVKLALKEIINPAIDRIISLNVRGEILNAQTYFMLLNFFEILAEATNLTSKDAIATMARDARKLGVKYMGLKEGSLENFLETAVVKTLNKEN